MERLKKRRAWLAAVVILAVVGVLPGGAAGQEENQAALVIQFPDGRVETACVSFEGEAIAGDDLLARSGLEVVTDPSSGMGVTVCRIEGEGCDFPAQHCFCQCMGGEECAYWNYFYREPGEETWRYSALGAALRKVPPGGVEAWVWGDGSSPPAADVAFEAVCALPTPTAEPTVPETATPEPAAAVPTETPEAAANTREAPAATATQLVAAADTPEQARPTATMVLAATATTAARESGGAAGGSYLAFGVILALLVGAGLVVLLRQRGGRRA